MTITDITNRIAKESVRIELLDEMGNDSDRSESINLLCRACIDLLEVLGRTPKSERILQAVKNQRDMYAKKAIVSEPAKSSYYAGQHSAMISVIDIIENM